MAAQRRPALPARAKATGGYLNSALAKSEALENGFDEAIMLTQDGHVSEGPAENLFLVKEGRFITPPVTDDILEGVTRKLLIGLVRDELGLEVVERSIDRTELYAGDELILCGTLQRLLSQWKQVEIVPRYRGAGYFAFSRILQRAYLAYEDWVEAKQHRKLA